MRVLVASVALTVALAGMNCKGKTVVKDNPQTAESLAQCQSNLQEKVLYINTLNEAITKLESAGAADGEVVVRIEGDVLEIIAGKGKGPHGPKDPKGNAKDTELYDAFVKRVRGSRGSIKKCYQNALKKNAALGTRTVTLAIGVQYKTSGTVKKASFTPRVSEQFNQCMDSIAKKWSLPAMPRAVSFSYKQTLTPE